MGIFEDEVYQKMDWLEKVCEPIVCELNDILNKLPNNITLTYDVIVNSAIGSYGPGQLSADNFIENHEALKGMSWSDKKRILKCFDIVVEGEPIIDLHHETFTGGEVRVVKIKEAFEEKEIKTLIGAQGVEDHIRRLSHKDVPTDRINEILELLGMSEARRCRSSKQKMDAFQTEMVNIMAENQWDIRDVALSNRVSLWIKKYLVDGNLAGYTNFCKLKVMTHYDAPIYSVEGEEEV